MSDMIRAVLSMTAVGGIALGAWNSEPAFAAAPSETAVLPGGCFLGAEGVLERV